MSNFLNQSCKICINTNDGTLSERLAVCFNELGKVISAKDLVTGADYTTTATIEAIEEWIITGTAPAGFTITKRNSCEVKTKFNDYELCMADSNGDLIVSGSISEEVDAELGIVMEIVSFEVFNSNDTNLVEGTVYRTIDGNVTYTSGSYKDGDLAIEVNGVALTQAPCVPCQSC